MAVNDDIYAALASVSGVDAVYDTKRPDGYDLTGAVLVFSLVSDVPSVPIDGAIIGHDQRWQVSVYVKDRAYGDSATPALAYARQIKADVIAALHGYESGSIKRADYDTSTNEIYDAEGVEYHIPVDFLIQT